MAELATQFKAATRPQPVHEFHRQEHWLDGFLHDVLNEPSEKTFASDLHGGK